MGDLAEDTAVKQVGEGRFQAELHPDWEIWGPMGGYVASCALRAAGAAGGGARPAAFTCHFLNGARSSTIDLRVEARKQGRSAAAHRVEVTQEGRAVLDAMVWSTTGGEGLEHDEATPPDVPGPDVLPRMSELVTDERRPPFPFWDNLDSRPLDFHKDWPPDGPLEPRWRSWLRFLPAAAFDDPWLDAARSVILVDLPSWPAGHRPHAWQEPPYVAPTLDLNVAFHRGTADEEWLLCDGAAPLSTGGLLGWRAQVWSTGGRLHASGGGQCLYRRLPDS